MYSPPHTPVIKPCPQLSPLYPYMDWPVDGDDNESSEDKLGSEEDAYFDGTDNKERRQEQMKKYHSRVYDTSKEKI